MGNRVVHDAQVGTLSLKAVDEPRRVLADGFGPVE